MKMLKKGELVPHFGELRSLAPEKWGIRALYAAGFPHHLLRERGPPCILDFWENPSILKDVPS